MAHCSAEARRGGGRPLTALGRRELAAHAYGTNWRWRCSLAGGAAGAADIPFLRRHLGRGHASAGTAIWFSTYYLSLIGVAHAPHWQSSSFSYADMYNYGALFDMAAAAVNRFSPLGIFETRHLLNATGRPCRPHRVLEARPPAGRTPGGLPAAALFLLLTPELLRPDVQQPKGHPVCRRVHLGDLLPDPPDPGPAASAVAPGDQAGVAIGLAMAVRIGGLLLLCYLGLLLRAVRTVAGGRRAARLACSSVWAGPACGASSCRSPRSPLRLCWCSGRGRRARRSSTRWPRWRCSRMRSSSRRCCSTGSSSPPLTSCRGPICRPISPSPSPNWCWRCCSRRRSSVRP